MFDSLLNQFNAEWQLTRGDMTGIDETEIFEIAKQAYPNNPEASKKIASDFLTARLKEKMKQ